MTNFVNHDRTYNQAATQHFYAPAYFGSHLADNGSRARPAGPNAPYHYSYTALRPVANYVPRPHLHRQIKERLHDGVQDATDTRILAVKGLGGSGKSQLVLNYVREYREDYSTIFWIEAGQKESIERDYLQIYRLLLDPTLVTRPVAVSVEDAVVAVKRWFHGQTERSLVLLDSADSIDTGDDESYLNLGFFLPDAPTVDVIITTQYAQVAGMTTLGAVEVGEMEATEAVELFQKCAELKSPHPVVDVVVPQIVAELGKLALAITLAGSYVAMTPRLRSDIRLYLPEYHERRKYLLATKAKRLIHRYAESVFSTWETSLMVVEQKSAMAARLLNLLAFLNFNDISPALFEQLTDGEKLAEGASKPSGRRWQSYLSPDRPADQYTVEAAFGVLETCSLIQWRDDRGGYTMHKLVHARGQDRLEVEQQAHLSLMALDLLTDIIPSKTGNLIFGTRLVPHVIANFAIISGITAASVVIHETLDSIAILGGFLHGLGRWSDEYEVRAFHFRKMCELAGAEHPDTLTSMNSLAMVLRDQGKYEQAEEMLRQALGLKETVLGKEHPHTLTSMNNLARVLRDQGKYEQAEEMHRQARDPTRTDTKKMRKGWWKKKDWSCK